VVSRAVGYTITDSTSGFRIICEPLLSEFAHEFPVYYLGDTFEAAVIAARAKYGVMEIPANLAPRLAGNSSSGLVHSILAIAKVTLIATLRLHRKIKMGY